MFYIVETEQQLQQLEYLNYKDVFIHIITGNDYYHPKLVPTVGVFIKPIGLEGFFIPIAHEEGFNVKEERISKLLDSYQTKYTIDRKATLYHFNLNNVVDLSLKHSLTYHRQLENQVTDSTIDWFYNRHQAKPDLNAIIPISILVRYCEKLYTTVEKTIKIHRPSGFEFYNQTATNIFYLIEQSGVGIDTSKFTQIYTPNNPIYNIKHNTIYTKYNLNNTTTRPTNSFNSINFAALPKKQQHREVFKPSNDFFVEYDFDGYHLRILADIVGYKIKEQSAHTYLAKKLFNKQQITDQEYNKAKQINFHAIYGNIPKKYENIVFFRMIRKYIDQLWEQYTNQGFVVNPISKFKLSNKIQDTNPAKLMNYMMQSLETANNVIVLKRLLKYLNNKSTKIVLYTYDAFVLDFNKKDGKDTLTEIKSIMEQDGKYPTKFKYNTNLFL